MSLSTGGNALIQSFTKTCTAIEQSVNKTRARLITFFALILSLSFILRLWQYGWMVNDDGALYLYAAKNFIDHGLTAALDTYVWAYYSIIVAYIDMVLFDNLMLSGWALNFIFQCGQIYFLYRICAQLHVRQPRIFWAILLFILSISFHNFRNYLMRDQGFLLFVIAGVYYSLLYIEHRGKISLVLFFLSFLLAALFRVEALILLCTGFVTMVYLTRKFVLGFMCFTCLILVMWASVELLSGQSSVNTIQHIASKVPAIFVTFAEQQGILESQLLSKYWTDYSGIGLFSLYFNSYIVYLLGSLSIYILGLFYLQRRSINPATLLLIAYGASIILYCLYFLFSRGFLVFRYSLPLTYALTLLSIILVLGACARRARLSRAVLGLFILASLTEVLDTPSGSKRYLLEAQAVVEEMGLSGKAVYSNALQISLINGVDFKAARPLRGNKAMVLKKIKQPLEQDVAVIYYGDTRKGVTYSDMNCLAYYKKHRSRSVSVYVAKNDFCLADKS